jgi:hypothetical protein
MGKSGVKMANFDPHQIQDSSACTRVDVLCGFYADPQFHDIHQQLPVMGRIQTHGLLSGKV